MKRTLCLIALAMSVPAAAQGDQGSDLRILVQKSEGGPWVEEDVNPGLYVPGRIERICAQHVIRHDPNRFSHAAKTIDRGTGAERVFRCDRASGKAVLQGTK